MWTLIIIIVVVVVVDDDTYYLVYLSSNHLFQVYYKVRQVLLQSATAFFITKCDGLLSQSATTVLLQSATSVITKCDRYYKVWQFYYKVRQVLQSATIITKCDSTTHTTSGPPVGQPAGPFTSCRQGLVMSAALYRSSFCPFSHLITI